MAMVALVGPECRPPAARRTGAGYACSGQFSEGEPGRPPQAGPAEQGAGRPLPVPGYSAPVRRVCGHALHSVFWAYLGICAVAFAALLVISSLIPTFLLGIPGVHNLALIGGASFLIFVTAAVSQAVSARMASRRSLEAGLPLLLVTLAALESALFAKALWLFVVGTLVGGVAVGFIFRGGLSELNRLAQPQDRAAVVSTFFVAAYVGLGLPAVLTGLISLPLGPVDASAWVSGLAAAAVALAYLVVRRVAPSSATRPCAAS